MSNMTFIKERNPKGNVFSFLEDCRVGQFLKASIELFMLIPKNGLFSCLGQMLELGAALKFGLCYGSFERKGWTEQFSDKTLETKDVFNL